LLVEGSLEAQREPRRGLLLINWGQVWAREVRGCWFWLGGREEVWLARALTVHGGLVANAQEEPVDCCLRPRAMGDALEGGRLANNKRLLD